MVHKCLETTPEVGITQLHNLGHTILQTQFCQPCIHLMTIKQAQFGLDSMLSSESETLWHSRLQTLPKMISPLFRRTQNSLGCLEIRNLILKMKILVWCAKIWLELNNLQKTARKQCFLAVF